MGEETKHIENPCDENSCAALPPLRDGDEDSTNRDLYVIHKVRLLEFMKLCQYSTSDSSAILHASSHTNSFPSGQIFPVLPIERSFRNFFPSAVIRIFICQFICHCSAAHIRNDSERPHTACTIHSLYHPSGGIHEAIFRITIHPSV